MLIEKLTLKNYRNYEKLDMNFNSKLNILIGNNAQGKSNILESIYVLSITKSYLNVNDKTLIKLGENYSIISARVNTNNNFKDLKIIINSKGKKVSINGNEINKMSDYISNLKIILFSPDNIRMLKEGPNIRRKFLNVEISQLSRKYIKYLMDYNNLIRQKNEYLKLNENKDFMYLGVLNDKISSLAVYLALERANFIDRLNIYISDIFFEITGINGLRIKYITNVDFENDKFRLKLEKNLDKEISYKMSLIGIHRDDFIFVLNDKNMSLYSSQGQLRCAVLALKLAEVKIFCEKDEKPVLLLDDIFSELDVNKKNNLIKYINNDVQTIITTTDINLIDKELVDNANIFKISNGKLFIEK